MNAFTQSLLGQGLLPHGYCLSWNRALLATLVSADFIIALSYFSIPFALVYFAHRRPDIPQRRMFWLFGAFIVACGVTHLFDIIDIWTPTYWAGAIAKSITAGVSLATAIILWRVMPVALRLPSSQQLETANRELEQARADLEKRVEERTVELAHSEEQLRLVLEGAELGFWDWDLVTGKVERNERWATMLGYTYEEIQNTTQQWSDFIHPDDRDMAWQSIQAVLEGRAPKHRQEYRMRHKSGSYRWILDQANVMQRDASGKPTRMSGTHSDVTDHKTLEMELQHQAHIDYLTGANNRRHFMEQAELELSRSLRYSRQLSLLMLDIDFFKQVNDNHGHKSGDLVLQGFVNACRKTMREVDILGRVGGEEFAILLPETTKAEALEAAERLREAVASNMISSESGKPLNITVSIGVASLSSEADTLDSLLTQADRALYDAKNSGRNKVCYMETLQ